MEGLRLSTGLRVKTFERELEIEGLEDKKRDDEGR